ncbi:MAG: prepilin-type N-terminal cleavage/methylation domain-containing protein [Zavarzinia sp.]|nr:prepilin-type N-terminal cleavage/methylation domain-containing protein [Zavarzinia sp.]
MSATGERGATLIEAMVVLAIMSLGTLLVFPTFDRLAQAGALRQTAERLAADLRRTRAAALSAGTPASLVPEAGGVAYRIGADRRRDLPRGFTLAGAAAVTFFPDGTARGSGLVVEGTGRRVAIRVDPVTGAVTSGESGR